MLQSAAMRKNIGWPAEYDGEKYEVRVIFQGGDQILWRRKAGRRDEWHAFEPGAEEWRTLVEKTRARYVRRQAPYRDLQLIERLAERAGREARPVAREPDGEAGGEG